MEDLRAALSHPVLRLTSGLKTPTTGTGGYCARTASGHTADMPPISVMNSRRLVCRESSILRDDGGRFTTPPPSRLEARSRLGS